MAAPAIHRLCDGQDQSLQFAERPDLGRRAGARAGRLGAKARARARQRNPVRVRGRGRAEVDGAWHRVSQGSTFMVGRFVQHTVENDGTVPLKMFWAIMPAGLEDWFRALGQPRTPGEPRPRPSSGLPTSTRSASACASSEKRNSRPKAGPRPYFAWRIPPVRRSRPCFVSLS
ncbi:MAG: cupin domain-containing protein [Gammaproteobacteria bacterium]|nr:cupin domain-containing protein [Gammaproteobacteria bacterium]